MAFDGLLLALAVIILHKTHQNSSNLFLISCLLGFGGFDGGTARQSLCIVH